MISPTIHRLSSRVYVKKGQLYHVPRRGLPRRYVRVVRVRNPMNATPYAIMQELTRTGREKGAPYRSVLTCNGDSTWRLAPGYKEVTK